MKRIEKEIVKRVISNNKKEQGITLLVLVITIVILIILSTVTISTVFGDEGLNRASQENKRRCNKYGKWKQWRYE